MSGNYLQWGQGILTITADASDDDARYAPSEVWSLPSITLSSYLILSLENILQSGLCGIRVVSDGVLPGTLDTKWTLEYCFYQGGVIPSPLIWTAIALESNQINHLVTYPLPMAYYRFRLVARQSGKDPVYYPEVAVTTPADEFYLGLYDVAYDGILSALEKPKYIIDFHTALVDYVSITDKANACGIAYTEYAVAFTALKDYMLSLVPAYDDTTQDSPLPSPASWVNVWMTYATVKTNLLIILTAAAPSTVDCVESTSNLNLTTNTSAPIIDGFTRAANDVVMLISQSTASENGVYKIAYSPSQYGGGSNVFPTTSTATGNGAWTNAANAIDADIDYASLTGPGSSASEVVEFSGWTGTWTQGNLALMFTPFNDTGGSSTVSVYYSIDGGATYILHAIYNNSNSNVQLSLSIPLTGVTPSLLRVKFVAKSMKVGRTPNEEIYVATARINEVYFITPTIITANWSYTKISSVPNGSNWRVNKGTARGAGKTYKAAVTLANAITLTAITSSYEPPLSLPTSDGQVLSSDVAGNKTWVTMTGGSGTALPANAAGVLNNNGTGTLTWVAMYTHPASHAPSIITQDASNRFTTDTEKLKWNTFNVPFYYEAALTLADKQPIWVAPVACTISSVNWYRDNTTAPTVQGTISIYQNGTLKYSVNITTGGASQTLIVASSSANSVAAGDVITAVVTTAGAGCANINVILKMVKT